MIVYQCLDCTSRTTYCPKGACPACGSRNLKKSGQSDPEPKAQASLWSQIRLGLCILLWVGFLVGLFFKLTGS